MRPRTKRRMAIHPLLSQASFDGVLIERTGGLRFNLFAEFTGNFNRELNLKSFAHPNVIAGEAPTLPPFAPASPDDLDKQHELGQFLTLVSDTSPLIPLPIRCGEGDMASLFVIPRSEVLTPTR